jgi:UDP-N-acetylmuramate dehydrogenase
MATATTAPSFLAEMTTLLPGADIRLDEPMARHTTLRIGGPADAWIAPSTVEQVAILRAFCAERGLACRALGAGSNLLVRDGGIRGVVLSTKLLRQLRREDATGVYVEAGVSTGALLRAATTWELGGVEFLGGVPGSVGGGLFMNAGTVLGEFKDVTTEVTSVDEAGRTTTRDNAACGFAYRHSAFATSDAIVAARLVLKPRAKSDIEADVRALRERRRAREPHGLPNAGSIFKNPPGEFAGRLIEQAGLKGTRVGDAEVSPAHANWIVNAGDATAADVLALTERVRQAVHAAFGVTLEMEVKVVGEDAK